MPILELLIRQLTSQGVERMTLSVGYLASLIEAYCGDGSRWGIAHRLSSRKRAARHRRLPRAHRGSRRGSRTGGQRRHDDGPRHGGGISRARVSATPRRSARTSGLWLSGSAWCIPITTAGWRDTKRNRSSAYEVSMGVNVLSAWAIERFVEGSHHLDLPDLLRAMRRASERCAFGVPMPTGWI